MRWRDERTLVLRTCAEAGEVPATGSQSSRIAAGLLLVVGKDCERLFFWPAIHSSLMTRWSHVCIMRTTWITINPSSFPTHCRGMAKRQAGGKVDLYCSQCLTESRQGEETAFLLHFQIVFLRWEYGTRCCCCRRCWWNNSGRFTFLCLQYSYVLRCFIASTAWKLWSSPLWDRRGNKMKFVSDQS